MEYPFKDLMPLDEVLAREGYYKDWTHLDPEVFYSLTQISNFIKTKGYGVDVRLLIAQLAEHFGLKTTQVVDLGNLLTAKHATLKTQFEQAVSQVNADRNALETQFNQSVAQMEAEKDAVIANATVDSEVILARGGKPTLQARLDDADAQLAQIEINVKDFGAIGDGVTDNTQAFQDAIDSLPTLKLSTYKLSNVIGNVSGGKLIIPRGIYIVKGTIYYKGGVIFEGEGMGTVIKHRPDVEDVDLFSPDSTKTTVINTIQGVVFQDFTIEGNFSNVTGGNSGIGFNLFNVGVSRIVNCHITSFKTGVKSWHDTIGGYYNVLSNSSVRACGLNLDVQTSAFNVNGCSFSMSASNVLSDYLISVSGGGGFTMTNSSIEGQANEALFYFGAAGISISGGYSENTRGRFADIDVTKTHQGSIAIQGMYMPNERIRFIGLYKGGEESDRFTYAYSMNNGISINEKGSFMPTVKNGSFKNGLYGWDLVDAQTLSVQTIEAGSFFSKQSLKLTKTGGTTTRSISQRIKLENPNTYITAMIKTDNTSLITAYANNTASELYNFVRMAEYGDSGWSLWAVWLPTLEKSREFTLRFGVKGVAPIGSEIIVGNIGVYVNGIDYFPIEHGEVYESDKVPTRGKWAEGDFVKSTTPSVLGYYGWICTQAGEFEAGSTPIFKKFGALGAE